MFCASIVENIVNLSLSMIGSSDAIMPADSATEILSPNAAFVSRDFEIVLPDIVAEALDCPSSKMTSKFVSFVGQTGPCSNFVVLQDAFGCSIVEDIVDDIVTLTLDSIGSCADPTLLRNMITPHLVAVT